MALRDRGRVWVQLVAAALAIPAGMALFVLEAGERDHGAFIGETRFPGRVSDPPLRGGGAGAGERTQRRKGERGSG